MDLKNICKFWSLIKTRHLLVCNIINMMPCNGCSQMLHIWLKTEKSFIAYPWRLLCVVGLEEYSAHDCRAATSGTARSSYLARVGPVFRTTRLSSHAVHSRVVTGWPPNTFINHPSGDFKGMTEGNPECQTFKLDISSSDATYVLTFHGYFLDFCCIIQMLYRGLSTGL